jgi:hypothetical protein
VLRVHNAKHPTTKPKTSVCLIPISIEGGKATASDKPDSKAKAPDKTKSVLLIPGTITQITKQVVIETEANTTLNLLIVVEKEKEKEKPKQKEK